MLRYSIFPYRNSWQIGKWLMLAHDPHAWLYPHGPLEHQETVIS